MKEKIEVVSTTNMLLFDKGRILFIRRDENLKDFPGWLMLPGGKHEHNETPLQAAIRETFEETGIKVSSPQLRVVATHYHEYRPKVYLVYIFQASKYVGKLVDRSEEGEPIWIETKKALSDPKLYPDLKRHIDIVLKSSNEGVIFTYHRFNSKLEIIETL